MAQVDFMKDLTTGWVKLSDEITFDSDKLYYIQCRGPNILLAVESSSEPKTTDGVLCQPYVVINYKVGEDDLYVRSLNGNCSINISCEG